MKNSNEVGGLGQCQMDFLLFLFIKHLKLSKNHLKTDYFFQTLVGGPVNLLSSDYGGAQTLKLSGKANWQMSDDLYHTEFVSWYVDYF